MNQGFISCYLSLVVFHRPGTLHDFHSHEIAEQLTLLDAELFYKIEVQRRDWGSGRGSNKSCLQTLVLFSDSPCIYTCHPCRRQLGLCQGRAVTQGCDTGIHKETSCNA